MKKLFILLLCVILMLISACSTNNYSFVNNDKSSQEESSDDTAVQPSTNQSNSHAVSVEDAAFDKMMEALTGYQQGTAGSSLKAYIAACGVLNFSEQFNEDEAAQFKIKLEDYMKNANELTISAIVLGEKDVQKVIEDILTKGTEDKEIAAMLKDAGNPNAYKTYSREKYNAVAIILNEVLQNYTVE